MNNLNIYGTRGSCSLASEKCIEFGSATTCILFNFGRTHIMVDCGSGINNALDDLKDIDELHLFISHGHLDHISGITTLLSSFGDKPLHIYGKTFEGITVKNLINSVMSKSLWPVNSSAYKNVSFHEIEEPIKINDVTISNMDSNHPGNCSLFKFEYKGNISVTAFDFCHLDGFEEKLISFAKGCDTLIYDGCFSKDELLEKPTWGHSTPDDGARIGKLIGAKKIIISHFGAYDDSTLNKWEETLKKDYPNLIFARSGQVNNELQKMVEIGALLGAEKDNDALLAKIVESCMDLTNADGGTLYLLNNDKLDFKVLINRSKNTKLIKKDALLDIPSVDVDGKNICAACFRSRKLINVPDCYNDKDYDFSGSRKYDQINDYRTQSVIVVPLIDEYDDVIGVLQLINASKDGVVIPFAKKDEEVLLAIANQATMSYVNYSYSQKIDDLLFGFVKVMSVGIDERTPYNANHTRNMVAFAEKFFDYENNTKGKYSVDSKKRREILMGIWLHDIGKILTPIDIMNKDSRLGELTACVENRFERRELLLKLSLANKEISQEQYNLFEQERVDQLETIRLANKVGFLDDNLKNKIDEIANKSYREINGEFKPVLTEFEHYQLSIKKGTLNNEERNVMQGHVSMTQKFLSQLNFPKYYDKIPSYAGNHHEFLDGSGYPNHLTKEDLDWPCRLITICDIYEALTAKDRPYKLPMSKERAFDILRDMASKGQLDNDLVVEFEKSI